jgi:hypothetical protein
MTEIVASNPIRGADVCVRLFQVAATGWYTVQEVLPTANGIKKLNWNKEFQGLPNLQVEQQEIWINVTGEKWVVRNDLRVSAVTMKITIFWDVT